MKQPLIDIALFGSCSVRAVHDSTVEVTGAKQKAVFAYLASDPNGTAARTAIQQLLWGHSSYDGGRQSLRRTLSDIKRSLGADLFDLCIHPSNVQIRLDLDLVRFSTTRMDGEFLFGLEIKEPAFKEWVERLRTSDKIIPSYGAPKPPDALPAPLQVKVANGRMSRATASALPEHDVQQRAKMGWQALTAYRESFGTSFNADNYAPLPNMLGAFDRAMGEEFDPSRMIQIGVMGSRIVLLSDDQEFVSNLPTGAQSDLRGFATQISVFLNRFPDWIKYLQDAEQSPEDRSSALIDQPEYNEFAQELASHKEVDREVLDEYRAEIDAATGPEGDDVLAKGVDASTRETLRTLAESAIEGITSGHIQRSEIQKMDDVYDNEVAKLKGWAGGFVLVFLKRRTPAIRRWAERRPERRGWMIRTIDWLFGHQK